MFALPAPGINDNFGARGDWRFPPRLVAVHMRRFNGAGDMRDYTILTYLSDSGEARAGVCHDGQVFDAAELLRDRGDIDARSVLGLLREWERVGDLLRDVARPARGGVALDGLPLAAPILYPGAIFAIGGNYTDHLQEMALRAGRELTKMKTGEPFFTMKTSAHSVIGSRQPIRHPAFTRQLDWEAEIGVVIGRPAENVPLAEAMRCVAGYLNVNDLSAREYVKREGLPNQIIHDWVGQKCFRDSCPMGPWLRPAEFVPDPYDLDIRLWVNGALKQNGSSRNMVYRIDEMIAYLSTRVTLRPGDVILTGCPAGVGASSGEFLKPGDEIRMEVTGCGTLVNRVVG